MKREKLEQVTTGVGVSSETLVAVPMSDEEVNDWIQYSQQVGEWIEGLVVKNCGPKKKSLLFSIQNLIVRVCCLHTYAKKAKQLNEAKRKLIECLQDKVTKAALSYSKLEHTLDTATKQVFDSNLEVERLQQELSKEMVLLSFERERTQVFQETRAALERELAFTRGKQKVSPESRTMWRNIVIADYCVKENKE